MKMNVCILSLSVMLSGITLFPQSDANVKEKSYFDVSPFKSSTEHWYNIHEDGNIINPLPDQQRYGDSDIVRIADNILIFQRDNGGWPKNYDMQAVLSKAQADSLMKTKSMTNTTFDNSTTYTHIEYLAKAYSSLKIEKYKEACLKGINFVLEAQYPNGGWPQYYPLQKNYSRRITYNDHAFIGVMELLNKIIGNDPDFSFVGDKIRQKAGRAFSLGLDCILKTQIIDKGRLTAWCQQHDETDLKPAWARAYEPPSICNQESADVVLFLMKIDHPDKRIIEAVQCAVKWFNDSKILFTRVETIPTPPETTQWRTSRIDRIVVIDSLAPPIWTRFYELGTEKPLFSDRNSKFLYSLSEVSHERRSGYAWYTYDPQRVLDKYPRWQKKWVPDQNILQGSK
jgi:PelA/Pel-15E family pectate lyase